MEEVGVLEEGKARTRVLGLALATLLVSEMDYMLLSEALIVAFRRWRPAFPMLHASKTWFAQLSHLDGGIFDCDLWIPFVIVRPSSVFEAKASYSDMGTFSKGMTLPFFLFLSSVKKQATRHLYYELDLAS